ncbi:MAG: RNA-processing protein [Candidatus Lokiarchaeota archaeon]|nr:RNA-processing protein [Candidatus Lokiarchaeota archaeon]
MYRTKYIKIPKKRIAILIGKNGSTKKYIENKSNAELEIDSKEGTVEIIAKDKEGSAISLWKAKDVVKAIARGFAPKKAFRLFDEDIYMEIIDLERFLNTRKQIHRIKGRIIGKSGKSRKIIEEMTDAYISVYGDTVSIIGEYLSFKIAKSAVKKLIQGYSHSSVYHFLQKNYNKIQRQKYSLWKTPPEVRDDLEF